MSSLSDQLVALSRRAGTEPALRDALVDDAGTALAGQHVALPDGVTARAEYHDGYGLYLELRQRGPRLRRSRPLTACTTDKPALRDLRDWLSMLDQAGALVTARPGVPLQFGVLGMIEHYEGTAACFLPRPGGHPVPIVGGTIGRREWIGMALGVPASAVLDRVAAAVANPIDWQLVGQDAAPVHEVTHRGGDIDLRRLMPIITCHERDAGPCITSGLVNGKNLQTGKQNLSINRMQVHAPNRLGILMLPRDLHAYFAYAESIGEPLPVTVTPSGTSR